MQLCVLFAVSFISSMYLLGRFPPPNLPSLRLGLWSDHAHLFAQTTWLALFPLLLCPLVVMSDLGNTIGSLSHDVCRVCLRPLGLLAPYRCRQSAQVLSDLCSAPSWVGSAMTTWRAPSTRTCCQSGLRTAGPAESWQSNPIVVQWSPMTITNSSSMLRASMAPLVLRWHK